MPTREMPTILFFCLLGMALSARATAPIQFGIPPQQSPSELAKRWTPIMHYLSEQIGVTIQLQTAKDIGSFQQKILTGEFDVAYINPNHYVAANRLIGYRAFAKEKGGKGSSLIVVHQDSPIKTLEQLNGHAMAFPSNTAVMATIMPLKFLEESRISVNPQYVVSIDSVYRSVAKGLFPAGGGEGRTFGALDPEVKAQLRILWEFDGFPPFPFFAHPRVDPALVSALQTAMIKMGNHPQGQSLLKAVNIKMLEKATDADYDSIRKLNLPLEVKY